MLAPQRVIVLACEWLQNVVVVHLQLSAPGGARVIFVAFSLLLVYCLRLVLCPIAPPESIVMFAQTLRVQCCTVVMYT
ncbi:hypothetical protein K461DRAFT_279269 [Myriangium duriaei CBS 260.36]|uniref:Uncharacterized protein n=1 Tax=Myriangium duriaei CBS 260.36 TaxID=1168546 RepID=A0A9P4MLI2_9PEZI|nr:hypothetical protein K461DRAFT_279269 [Myriangium duriaei CBS 260.36]